MGIFKSRLNSTHIDKKMIRVIITQAVIFQLHFKICRLRPVLIGRITGIISLTIAYLHQIGSDIFLIFMIRCNVLHNRLAHKRDRICSHLSRHFPRGQCQHQKEKQMQKAIIFLCIGCHSV